MMQSLQGMVKTLWSPNIYETRKSELSLMDLSLSIIHPSTANPSISSLVPYTQNKSWINLLLCTSGASQTHLSSWLYLPVSTLAPFNPLSTEQPDWSLKNVTQITALYCFKPSSSSSWNLEWNPHSLPLMSASPWAHLWHFPSSRHSRSTGVPLVLITFRRVACALAVTSSWNTESCDHLKDSRVIQASACCHFLREPFSESSMYSTTIMSPSLNSLHITHHCYWCLCTICLPHCNVSSKGIRPFFCLIHCCIPSS